MSALETRVGPASLADAISQMISLGFGDPITIARELVHRHGGDWVAEQLAANWEEILAEIARQQLGNERRSAVVSLSSEARARGGKVPKRDAVLTRVFIPGDGYVALGECSRDQLLTREAYMRRLAGGIARWADWFGGLAAELDRQGVERVKQLRGALPPLPGPEEALGS